MSSFSSPVPKLPHLKSTTQAMEVLIFELNPVTAQVLNRFQVQGQGTFLSLHTTPAQEKVQALGSLKRFATKGCED